MDLVDKIRDRTEKLFSGSNGSHDWEHTMRVYKLCMHIGEKEDSDLAL
jgi:HD superfamily phosphodiesterase